MYRKYGKGSLWVGSHIDARIPDVDAEQLIDLTCVDHHSKQQRPQVPPTHPINFTRRIACDLAEGVGRDSTCIMVLDDWGVLEVVLSNAAGLPEAAATIHRLGGIGVRGASGRVDLGGCPPRSATDPGLHITRTRFLIS